MATTLPVERIDIIEGPNLDKLTLAFVHAVPRPGGIPQGMYARFNEVMYFGANGVEVDELGNLFTPQIVGICYLGNEASTASANDFVITVKFGGGTFVGHYNTHSRKGCVSLVK